MENTESPHWKRTLYIMFFAQLMTAVGFSSIFPFLPLYVKSLGATTNLSIELLAGLVYSGPAFAMIFASPLWGMLADRYGHKLMVQRSMFGGTILLFLMSFARSAEELVFLRILQGFVTGTLAAVNALVATVCPRKYSGYAMGLLQVGLGSGVALGPLIGGIVADTFGYSAAFYITSAFLLSAGVVVLVGVREDVVKKENTATEKRGFSDKWRRILSAPGVTVIYILRFMNQLGRMMIIPVVPLFVETLLSAASRVNTFTGLVIGVASVTTTVSAIYLGRLGDRIGHRRIVIVSALVASLIYIPQSLVTEGWQLLVLQAMVGVAMGGITPSISALLVRYTQVGEEGAVYGLDNSVNAGARAIAPLLGAGVAKWFGLRITFSVTASVFFLAGIIALYGLPHPKTDRGSS